jgi:hypothetical protein
MMRRFQFEGEIYESLSCLPMAARRKLDLLGLKISHAQWLQLGRGERLMICHAPANSAEESEALSLFINEATVAKGGSAPKEQPEIRVSARPPKSPSARLIENAKSAGVTLTQAAWDALDDDQRYALTKLGGAEKLSHKLKAAINEFLGG